MKSISRMALWSYVFKCFVWPTLWAYVFRRFGTADALVRRLCSESLPGYRPLTTLIRTRVIRTIENALVVCHDSIKVVLPLEDFIATAYETAAKFKIILPNSDFS